MINGYSQLNVDLVFDDTTLELDNGSDIYSEVVSLVKTEKPAVLSGLIFIGTDGYKYTGYVKVLQVANDLYEISFEHSLPDSGSLKLYNILLELDIGSETLTGGMSIGDVFDSSSLTSWVKLGDYEFKPNSEIASASFGKISTYIPEATALLLCGAQIMIRAFVGITSGTNLPSRGLISAGGIIHYTSGNTYSISTIGFAGNSSWATSTGLTASVYYLK